MKKKRMTAVTTALILALSLCACGGKGSSGGTASGESTSTKSEAVASVSAEPVKEESAAEPQADNQAEKQQESTPAPQESASEAAGVESQAAGIESQAAEPTAEPETKPIVELPSALPVEGTYIIFGAENEGYQVYSSELEIESAIELGSDGSGTMSFNGDQMGITTWSLDNESFSLTMEDGSSAAGSLRNGIIELDLYGDGSMLLFYAQEQADTSGYALLTLDQYRALRAEEEENRPEPDSKLFAVFKSLDSETGVHFKYQLHSDYMDALMDIDAQGRGGNYYSSKLTHVSGFDNLTVTYLSDGKAYMLDPDNRTGTLVTETSMDIVLKDAMLMDGLYSAIRTLAYETEYTEEMREMNGTSYAAEVFAATDTSPEKAFLFNEDGTLAYYTEGAPVIEGLPDIGESIYTVEVMDGVIDEALFDISGYSITE